MNALKKFIVRITFVIMRIPYRSRIALLRQKMVEKKRCMNAEINKLPVTCTPIDAKGVPVMHVLEKREAQLKAEVAARRAMIEYLDELTGQTPPQSHT